MLLCLARKPKHRQRPRREVLRPWRPQAKKQTPTLPPGKGMINISCLFYALLLQQDLREPWLGFKELILSTFSSQVGVMQDPSDPGHSLSHLWALLFPVAAKISHAALGSLELPWISASPGPTLCSLFLPSLLLVPGKPPPPAGVLHGFRLVPFKWDSEAPCRQTDVFWAEMCCPGEAFGCGEEERR